MVKGSWRKVLEITTPSLPLVICTRRLVEEVLNVRFLERGVQPQETPAHSLRLVRAYAEPEQVHLLRECGRIRKQAIVIGLGVPALFCYGT